MTNIEKLALKIKKEHFIKMILWTFGIVLTILWIAMVLATSISGGEHRTYSKALVVENQESFNKLINGGYTFFVDNDNQKIMAHKLLDIKDWNPLCLTYKPSLTGWYICVLLAPIGYLGIIFIIAVLKNMITPNKIKVVARKSLQFGYLKQNEVDFICESIDINLGIKETKYKEVEKETK